MNPQAKQKHFQCLWGSDDTWHKLPILLEQLAEKPELIPFKLVLTFEQRCSRWKLREDERVLALEGISTEVGWIWTPLGRRYDFSARVLNGPLKEIPKELKTLDFKVEFLPMIDEMDG